jgi:cytochrome c556
MERGARNRYAAQPAKAQRQEETMRHRVAPLLIAAALAMPGPGRDSAQAQDKAALIKQRQALMKQQAADLKAIQNYVSGTTNQETALAKAKEMMSLPPQIVGLFPAGTSLVEFPGATHAKPEIWREWDRFRDVPSVLLRAEQRLADAVANGDKQDVLDQLDTVGRAGCGACHTYFRAPLED